MTTEQQIKALAELDGWKFDHIDFSDRERYAKAGNLDITFDKLPNYLTSYDAIIPLIQKLPSHVRQKMDAHYELVSFSYGLPTPAQLCEALLRAVGKWKVD